MLLHFDTRATQRRSSKFRTFTPLSGVKIRGGIGQMSESIFRVRPIGPTSDIYTCSGRPFRGLGPVASLGGRGVDRPG